MGLRLTLQAIFFLSVGGLENLKTPEIRGCPETFSYHRREITQRPCGNETQGDRRERVGSAEDEYY